MLKTLLLAVFTLTLTLGCSNKLDNKVACGLKCAKPCCAEVKADCGANCDKPCCVKTKVDKGDCGTDCDKPCPAKSVDETP